MQRPARCRPAHQSDLFIVQLELAGPSDGSRESLAMMPSVVMSCSPDETRRLSMKRGFVIVGTEALDEAVLAGSGHRHAQ
jgi:hypothetical protein